MIAETKIRLFTVAADRMPRRKGCAMKIVYVAFFAAFFAMPVLAQSPQVKNNNAHNSKAVQEVIDFRNRYIKAEEDKDIEYLAKVFAHDFYALNAQGQLMDKPHLLENLKRTDRTFKLLNPRDTEVHFYGNVAILYEVVTVDGEDKGHHFGGEFRFVRVFAKQNGNWQVVLAQGSPLSAQTPESK
jgi:ketosteroid isomerase-like protein